MLHSEQPEAGAGARRALGTAGMRVQAAVVELTRDERADLRVHAVGGVQEDPAVLGDRLLAGEGVRERTRVRAGWVIALDDLAELAGIAEQDQVVRGRAAGERVGERE